MVFGTRVLLARQWIKNPAFRKWMYNLDGYNKFGFYQNDLECLGQLPFHPGTEAVYAEALRRLPADEYDRWAFRCIRSAQLEITKTYIPESERITFEEDQTKGRYLEPYVKEILAERKEKEDWQDFLSK
ncbi:unnamed protein product [Medioppia subpectinata]|uniref:Cytochrome b-c1 complex subunit 7 n=1 Tax=Medioppia subpectinata TaxID=1979941 RepID=A0A7R9KKR7_9ACAR|nr:unnamed protein product [Medioppia subpectinata]CAG2105052.1 unnamed protein product [Medioppia subpectinata]